MLFWKPVLRTSSKRRFDLALARLLTAGVRVRTSVRAESFDYSSDPSGAVLTSYTILVKTRDLAAARAALRVAKGAVR